MSTQKESIWVKLGGIGGIAAVLSLLLYVRAQRSLSPSSRDNVPPETSENDSQENQTETTGNSVSTAEDTSASAEADSPGHEPEQKLSPWTPILPPPRSDRVASEMPTEFTLSDGEQKVLLSGQASVGIQFNQIGEERFLTLRINSAEGSTSHAILSTGTRPRFRHAGSEYYISVLRLDYTARTAVLRMDRVRGE